MSSDRPGWEGAPVRGLRDGRRDARLGALRGRVRTIGAVLLVVLLVELEMLHGLGDGHSC